MTQSEIKVTIELHIKWLRGEDGGKRANLTGADLRGANLTGANLRGANLTDADLTGANLTGANLTGANLKGANLTGANLRASDLTGASLRGANLKGANLTGSDLMDADLDFSVWPLWCGSLRAKIGKRLFCQLAYHICRVSVDDQDCTEARKALIPLANEFHRVKSGELPTIEEAAQ